MSTLQNLANFNIGKLRKEKKFSREDMAHHLDISLEAYRKIENGTTNMNLDRLEQICEVLEIDIFKILAPHPEKYSLSEVNDQGMGTNIYTVNHGQD
ncbi:helix-turn-helix domain-containing protein [Runella aurantiaca]|uniref:XRE family transcriptional regulator n=1 Tax=Runella aurantiaca TaxID=2282308 RepID=A0A369I7Y7_9BACT|nr:helix-turn-helix transcriptional regulator [Runella aurantiaca]RDB05881.1 XRE family transcriptional regulator [Runella aurantiaca]